MKRIILIIITVMLLMSCSEEPRPNNPFDPAFELPGVSDFQVNTISYLQQSLSWNYELDNIEGFILKRKENDFWQEISILPAQQRNFMDTTLSVNCTIQYSITAFADENTATEVLSEELENYILTPEEFQIEQLAAFSYHLSWQQEHITGEEGFILERKITNGNFMPTAILPADTESYTDTWTGRSQNEVIYRISAYVDSFYSSPAETSSTILPPPADFKLSVLNANEINLSWQYSLSGIDGFLLEQRGDNGIWETAAELTSTTYNWFSPVLTATSSFRLYVTAADIQSSPSATVSFPINEFIEIPAGEFTFGVSDELEDLSYNYQIMKYEVTNLQYRQYLEEAFNTGHLLFDDNSIIGYYEGDEYYPSGYYELYCLDDEPDRITWDGSNFAIQEDYETHPVVNVSWFGAWHFANYYGWRLPTDFEWEKAARSSSGYDYPWGNELSGDRANYVQSGDPWDDGTTPVGYYNGENSTQDSPSPFGVYDLCGNTWNWLQSQFEESSEYRVLRGGSWNTNAQQNSLRSWYRLANAPVYRNFNIGFRCCQD